MYVGVLGKVVTSPSTMNDHCQPQVLLFDKVLRSKTKKLLSTNDISVPLNDLETAKRFPEA